jgi:RNA polymerase sigma-70 factor (ECF subfamily)
MIEPDLVGSAQSGDEHAFGILMREHHDRIRLHCYRMLGSLHDAEDATQETMLKAWRRIHTFEQRSSFGTWVYRIATTTCLNILRSRPRVVVPQDFSGRGRPAATDVAWLEPYPDLLLRAVEPADPPARLEMKEATRLAFVATIQLLPPRQRAVLLLRDVLSFSIAETAQALDTTEAAVNSALQRARARLADHRVWEDEATSDVEAIVDEWMACWERCDVDGLTKLLTDDARMAMPPTPAWFLGPSEIGRFFATVPAEGRLDTIRLTRTGANGQSAVAAYLESPEGTHVGYGLMVFDVTVRGIQLITGFSDQRLFPWFGLPEIL